MKSAAVPGSFDPERRPYHRPARPREGSKEAIDLLNVDANGATRSPAAPPTKSRGKFYDLILNGDGSHAGLKQLIAERKAADLGSTGLGRLTLTPAAAGVTVSEGAPGLPFGFKISGAAADGSGIVASFTAGPPASAGLTLAGQPADGDKVRLVLTLPDGTQQTVELTARTTVSPGAPENAFAIGASIAATAANLATAMTSALGRAGIDHAGGRLGPGGGAGFLRRFALQSPPPRRRPAFRLRHRHGCGHRVRYGDLVPGRRHGAVRPCHGAGESSMPARRGAGSPGQRARPARGAGPVRRAGGGDLPGLRQQSRARYEALAQRVTNGLSAPGSGQSVADIATELATSRLAMDGAKERHTATKALLQDRLEQWKAPPTRKSPPPSSACKPACKPATKPPRSCRGCRCRIICDDDIEVRRAKLVQRRRPTLSDSGSA